MLCVNDWWKAKNSTPSFDGSLEGIDVRYMTKKKMPPFAQESLSPAMMDLPSGKDFDVILNYNTFLSGYYLAEKYNAPMIYDLADDMPEMVSTSQQIMPQLRKVGGRFAKMWLMKSLGRSSKVSCISQQLADKYEIPKEKTILAPNGVNTDLFRPIKSEPRESLEFDYSFILGYVGVLREWVNLEPLFDVLMETNDVGMIIVGDEGKYREVNKSVRDRGIKDKVHFSGAVKYSEVPKHISLMDVCTIPFIKNDVTNNAVPLKLFEYLACGKQVISTDLLGVREAIGNRIYYAETSMELLGCVNDLMSNGVPDDVWKENREIVCEKYSWDCTSQQIESALEEII